MFVYIKENKEMVLMVKNGGKRLLYLHLALS